MNCDACARAETSPLTGRYTLGCMECASRALAHSPVFFTSVQAEAMTPDYRSALQAMFEADWKEAHALVKKWHERIAKAKQQPGNP